MDCGKHAVLQNHKRTGYVQVFRSPSHEPIRWDRKREGPALKSLPGLLAMLLISFGLLSPAYGQEAFTRLFETAQTFPRDQILEVGSEVHNGELVGKKLRIFLDANNLQEKDAADALLGEASSFSPYDIPFFGPTHSVVWSMLVLRNKENRSLNLNFEVDYQVAQHIRFTVIRERGLVHSKTAGNAEPFDQRDKLTRTNVFSEVLPPGYTVILLSSWGDVSQQLPLRIWTEGEFYHNELKRRTFIDLIAGCALALLLYNIFLFVSLRDPIYFFYSLYVFLNIAFHGTEHGFLREFFYFNLNWEVLPSWLNVVMVDAIVLAAYGFCKRFAGISFKSRLGKLYLFGITLSALDVVNALFFSPTISLYVAAFNASAAFCVFIFSGMHLFREAGSQVRLYMVAWGCYLIGGFRLNRQLPRAYRKDHLHQVWPDRRKPGGNDYAVAGAGRAHQACAVGLAKRAAEKITQL